jgi:uncharacterized protein (DUF849 family)
MHAIQTVALIRRRGFHGVLPRLNQATDAILNISTGGSAVMTLDQRLAAPQTPNLKCAA